MTKLEDVARALCNLEDDPDRLHSFSGEPMWTRHLTEARAAIEGLRMPSDTIQKALMAPFYAANPDPDGVWVSGKPDEVWQSIIDAILNEKPE